jgi:hypothetical protein
VPTSKRSKSLVRQHPLSADPIQGMKPYAGIKLALT